MNAKISEQPNILLFMLDQLSAKWLEAAMAGACEVSNLARLAAEGVTYPQRDLFAIGVH